MPYEYEFIRFIGRKSGVALDGFAADYDGLLNIKRVSEMQVEIPSGC
ncbi:MAG: short-chain dehydrogenase [Candidatus Thiodiazotropha sp. (ex Myrtea sp. 'scaly one' KF741663)]|nr:short-chain dehydrogenase [Candidatus Thiodiazotropha sp. (ex Myrtea sp. 'scaly one' KF741663)]